MCESSFGRNQQEQSNQHKSQTGTEGSPFHCCSCWSFTAIVLECISWGMLKLIQSDELLHASKRLNWLCPYMVFMLSCMFFVEKSGIIHHAKEKCNFAGVPQICYMASRFSNVCSRYVNLPNVLAEKHPTQVCGRWCGCACACA